MPRRRQIEMPTRPDLTGLHSADELRWLISQHPEFHGMTDAELGRRLNLTAGFVGMVLSGTRAPSKAFLDAIGWEATTLYRLKSSEA